MKIPKKISICGHSYKIIRDDRTLLEEECHGVFQPQNKTILLATKKLHIPDTHPVTDSQIFETLIHEIVHAIKHHLGQPDNNERIVEAESLAWAEIIKQLKK